MDTPIVPTPTPVQPAPSNNTQNSTVMGVLSYIGVLVIVPYLMSKDVPFVKFHIKQGAVLAIIEIVLWVVSGMFWGLWFFISIIQLATIILSIIGIVNVVEKKEKELPFVGSFAKFITI
jgi:uncharacterized membrane protein